MKKPIPDKSRLLLLLFALFLTGNAGYLYAQVPDSLLKRCATMERLEHITPDARRFVREAQERIGARVTAMKKEARTGETEIIRIPVVVHVIHNRADGVTGGRGNPNISDEQIHSQIQILNEDYRRMSGTPGYNNDPVGADARIEFFLAEVDPDGSGTTGITRHLYTRKQNFDPYGDAETLAGIVSWPSDEYLNIWVCRLTSNYLGLAQFPSVQGMPGLDMSEADLAATDGVMIDFRYFGNTGAVEGTTYNRGRTTTHEVGHWLGLIHIWGDSRCGDDYCDDTPPAERSNQTTNPCTDVFSNCLGTLTRNMIENFMDYSPDRCMNIFTKDQVDRMHAVLQLSPRRIKLVENSRRGQLPEKEHLEVGLYPNPLENHTLDVYLYFKGYQDVELVLFDLTGRVIDRVQYQKMRSHKISRPVGPIPPGIYLLQVKTSANEKIIKRFIVN